MAEARSTSYLINARLTNKNNSEMATIFPSHVIIFPLLVENLSECSVSSQTRQGVAVRSVSATMIRSSRTDAEGTQSLECHVTSESGGHTSPQVPHAANPARVEAYCTLSGSQLDADCTARRIDPVSGLQV